jgi:hypothetical protein
VGNARAVKCPGVFGRRDLRASLGGGVGAFSRRQRLTLANMGGISILKTNLDSDSSNPESNSSSKSNEWLRLNLFRAVGNHEFESRLELTDFSIQK